MYKVSLCAEMKQQQHCPQQLSRGFGGFIEAEGAQQT
jgi:hypothetical protein